MPYGTVNADVIQTSTSGGILGAGNASIMKNRIINGAMVIDQRNAGASVTVSGSTQYPVDRFVVAKDTAGATCTAQQSSTAPIGFTKSLLWTTTTGATSGASDESILWQNIEGYNVADLGWGTANAKTVTLSFWVKSSLTGTFGVSFRSPSGSRNYVGSYTINSADTWEYETVTVSGDTTGTWPTDNSTGLRISFDMGCGTSKSTTAGSWGAGNLPGLTGGVKVSQNTGATFYITGVQLEVGSSATGFEYVNYQTSLANCQRYYAKLQNDGTGGDIALGIGMQQSTTATASYINFPVTMRSEPTVVMTNMVVSDFLAFSATATLASVNMGYNSGALNINYSANGATYRPIYLVIANATSGNIALSAEL